ncbi:MAG: CDC27 family protein [Sulfuricurvum sp.]|nr:CDC27 family protein [Sulfuricurvum sp.]
MLDIKRLERRWLKYKIKKFLPYAVGVIAILILGITTFFWTYPEDSKNAPKVVTLPQKLPAEPVVQPIETTVLEPSMEFVQSFQGTPPPQKAQAVAAYSPKPVQRQVYSKPVVETFNVPEYTPPQPKVLTPAPKVSTNANGISINRDESKLDIDELQSRFKENSNANLGLFIARYHYEHGNYSEAYNYALKTNTLNNRIDESWILFAKSLVKLNRIDQAKKTLQLYISQSNSDNAKGLLESIDNGSFK